MNQQVVVQPFYVSVKPQILQILGKCSGQLIRKDTSSNAVSVPKAQSWKKQVTKVNKILVDDFQYISLSTCLPFSACVYVHNSIYLKAEIKLLKKLYSQYLIVVSYIVRSVVFFSKPGYNPILEIEI